MGQRTYRVVRVGGEEAQDLARLVDRHVGVDEVYVRGIADAVRVEFDETPGFVPDGHGYFEETVGFEDAVAVLPSLTLFVAYSDGNGVMSWREDRQVYLRDTVDGGLVEDARGIGLEPEEAADLHEGVLAEDEGNRQAEEKRKDG